MVAVPHTWCTRMGGSNNLTAQAASIRLLGADSPPPCSSWPSDQTLRGCSAAPGGGREGGEGRKVQEPARGQESAGHCRAGAPSPCPLHPANHRSPLPAPAGVPAPGPSSPRRTPRARLCTLHFCHPCPQPQVVIHRGSSRVDGYHPPRGWRPLERTRQGGCEPHFRPVLIHHFPGAPFSS